MDSGFDKLDVIGVGLHGTRVELSTMEANVESVQTGTVKVMIRLTEECGPFIKRHEKSADLQKDGDDIVGWVRVVRGFDGGLRGSCAERRENSQLCTAGHLFRTNCKDG
jgi:hypothetical protein